MSAHLSVLKSDRRLGNLRRRLRQPRAGVLSARTPGAAKRRRLFLRASADRGVGRFRGLRHHERLWARWPLHLLERQQLHLAELESVALGLQRDRAAGERCAVVEL